jgi:formylmethanofuran dehydrogenase subunit E
VTGYTVLRCAAPECGSPLVTELLAVLRECVSTSRGGVLVSTGCTFGRLACRLRPSGPVLLVQPCDAERRPTRPAVRVGPLCTPDDLAAVRTWLRAGWIDPSLLPTRLTALDRDTRAAATN